MTNKDVEIILERLSYERENLPRKIEKVQDRAKDSNGCLTSMLSMSFRFLGIAEYVLNHDVSLFKANLKEAAKLRLNLFQRFEAGEPIDKSLVTMLSRKDLFNTLAAGDFGLARELASVMGGRDAIEKEYDHPFDYAFGYTLKWFVLQNRPEMEHWTNRFRAVCQQQAPGGFAGYVELFEAIRAGSRRQAAEAVPALIQGHEKMSKGRGIFALTDDKHLCVWGIGMLNMARGLYGLDVSGAPPLIPEELLCPIVQG